MLTSDSRYLRCLPEVLKYEGGFVDHPLDPGGATNLGISLAYARGQGSMFDLDGDGDIDKQDILLVSPQFAGMVYRQWFWSDVMGDKMPAGLDLVQFDFAVNSGASRPIKLLQRLIRVEDDGFIGPKTLRAIHGFNDREELINDLLDGRMSFLQGLRQWPTFGRGWTSRVEAVRKTALEWVKSPEQQFFGY